MSYTVSYHIKLRIFLTRNCFYNVEETFNDINISQVIKVIRINMVLYYKKQKYLPLITEFFYTVIVLHTIITKVFTNTATDKKETSNNVKIKPRNTSITIAINSLITFL